MTGHEQRHVQEATSNDTFVTQMLLSCFVFWLFGFLFGLIAFILAGK